LFDRRESGELILNREGLYADAGVHAALDYAGLRVTGVGPNEGKQMTEDRRTT
jgi:hypothetical protein